MKKATFYCTLGALLLVLQLSTYAQNIAVAGGGDSGAPSAIFPGTTRIPTLHWWAGNEASLRRQALIDAIDTCRYAGLHNNYSTTTLRSLHARNNMSGRALQEAEGVFSSTAYSFCSDLVMGADISSWLSYNGIKAAPVFTPDSLRSVLNSMESAVSLGAFIRSLEPSNYYYGSLRAALRRELKLGNADHVAKLTISMCWYRWLFHYRLDSFILVNIPSATLSYFNDSFVLYMRTVVGKPGTRTPRFAAYVDKVILYPYWVMPRSILVNEWLAAFRKNPSLINRLGMEVVDGRGRVINPVSIRWSRLTSNNFPYSIREATGCQNPLGVIKFHLTSPFDVYLHDTNFKGAFLAMNRLYSHGCIRLQEPIALANSLLARPVDASYLQACYKDQPPLTLSIPGPVPIFVLYMPAESAADGSITYYRDIYNLLK